MSNSSSTTTSSRTPTGLTTPQVAAAAQELDLTNCDREPIHIPGRVQSHGVLVELEEPGHRVRHVSANCQELLGVSAEGLLGQTLDRAFDADDVSTLIERLAREGMEGNPLYLHTLVARHAERPFHAIAHRYGGRLFAEFEPATRGQDVSFHNLYTMLRASTARLNATATVQDLCQAAAEEVRRLTGFDRVMIYQFDADWNGRVVAEDRAASARSYLDQHFPASDIPRQARELYVLNRVRLIADVASTPAELLPRNGPPVDLTFAVLRSVSPIHIQYLQNMDVGASMSVSIVRDDKLWGLIACHHPTALKLPYEVRTACDHLGQIVALKLSATADRQDAEHRIRLKSIQTKLLAHMAAHEQFVDGLVSHPEDTLAIAGASGAAVCVDGVFRLLGQTPTEPEVKRLIDWLGERPGPEGPVYVTDSLASEYPPAEAFRESASGVLAVSLPRFRKSYVAWFRPERVLTVTWAGDPRKPVEPASGQLNPRKSFEAWKEQVHLRSLPWSAAEVSAVTELRDAIVGIILKKAEELQTLNDELHRTNRELEAFSYSVSHDLRAPFRHIVGFGDLLRKRLADKADETTKRYVQTIMDAGQFAGSLVDSLLAFSQMGRSSLRPTSVRTGALVRELRDELVQQGQAGPAIEWVIADDLPNVHADGMMLRLALQNLMSNAVKYSRTRQKPRIEIGSRVENNEATFWVRDNGVGFDPTYAHKLFGVFQRLHRPEEFEGTGIGLANVRRIVERHGGRAWAEGQVDAGATFWFTLPLTMREA